MNRGLFRSSIGEHPNQSEFHWFGGEGGVGDVCVFYGANGVTYDNLQIPGLDRAKVLIFDGGNTFTITGLQPGNEGGQLLYVASVSSTVTLKRFNAGSVERYRFALGGGAADIVLSSNSGCTLLYVPPTAKRYAGAAVTPGWVPLGSRINIGNGTVQTAIVQGTDGQMGITAPGVVAATYGDATHVAQVQFLADGRATAASSVLITGVAPSAHATTHQNGGSDEIATAASAANAIPKAGAGGVLDTAWVAGLSLKSVQYLAAGVTAYTKPAGITVIEVEVIGPGGGGAGVPGTASQVATGGGGGAGGYGRKLYTAAASVTVSVGVGGVGGTAGANNGSVSAGNTVFDTLGALGTAITANKGLGGLTMTAAAAVGASQGGAGGAAGTGGTINYGGNQGDPGVRLSGTIGTSGNGAPGWQGGGGAGQGASAVGGAATGAGAGGGGAMSTSGTTRAGGNGGDGLIVVREYA